MTVIDSTLFHSLPVEARDDYLRAVHAAAASGASYFVLVFARGVFPAGLENKPNEVDEDELRAAVSNYWEIDDVRPVAIHANVPQRAGLPGQAFERDEKNRVKFPAFLLSAHKAA